MNCLVLENDLELPPSVRRYVSYLKHEGHTVTVATMASSLEPSEIIGLFAENDALVFSPTQITFNQYNFMMMSLYSLLMENRLSIKEIFILDRSAELLEEQLSDLWRGKRKYLDQVLKHVAIYSIPYGGHEVQKLNL